MYICVLWGCTFVYRYACRGHRVMWGHLLRQYGGRIPHLSPVPSDSTSLVNHLFQGSPIAASRVLGSQVDLHLHTPCAQEMGVLLLVGLSLPQHRRSGQSWAKHAQAYGRRTRTEPPGKERTTLLTEQRFSLFSLPFSLIQSFSHTAINQNVRSTLWRTGLFSISILIFILNWIQDSVYTWGT